MSPAKSITQKVIVTSLDQIPTSLKRIDPRVYDFSTFSDYWGNESRMMSNLPCSSVNNVEVSLASTTDASYMLADNYVYFVTLSDTSKVKSFKGAFYGARFLKSLTMTGDISNVEDFTDMFKNCASNGTFYYNPEYDYSKIIEILPKGWVAKPIE